MYLYVMKSDTIELLKETSAIVEGGNVLTMKEELAKYRACKEGGYKNPTENTLFDEAVVDAIKYNTSVLL
jgi:hypothetical protein